MNSPTFHFFFIGSNGQSLPAITYTPGNPHMGDLGCYREAAAMFPDAFAEFERVVIYSTRLNTTTSYTKDVFSWVLGLAPHPEDPSYMGHPTPAVQE